MNYFLPYLKETEVGDVLKPEGYEPLRNKNGYGRILNTLNLYPRFHLHLKFHENEDFMVFFLHFDRGPHEDGHSAEYMTACVKKELIKLKNVVMRRIVYKASERGHKHYGTINIYRLPMFPT